jgi:magnesium chelatase subunit D
MRPPGFPFPALVGLDALKMALQLAAIDRRLSVLIRGDKGTGKSTAARGLVDLLEAGAPFINLPIGATEDRLLGGLDIEKALKGSPALKAGLLTDAHGGVLYVDEVNLLPDHLADALLDAAASGVHVLEREGFSVSEAADFVMVGSMNPEEGALRPQLLDRFALAVDVAAPMDPSVRRAVIERRLSYDASPASFAETWRAERARMAQALEQARARLVEVILPGEILDLIAERVAGQRIRSLRADLAIVRGSRALAALEGASTVATAHVDAVLPLALAHRLDARSRDPRAAPPQAPQPPRRDGEREREREREGDTAEPQEPSDSHGAVPERVFAPIAVSVPRLVVEQTTTRAGASSESSGLARGVAIGARQSPEPRELDTRASLLHAVTRSGGGTQIRADDLHERIRTPQAGTRFLFVVDSSGSHGAQERMRTVKGAVNGLLARTPGRHDEVVVIGCRGAAATVLVEPTPALADVERALDYLPTGGRTPLAHALELAAGYVTDASVLILITDGHANVPSRSDDPWADALSAAGAIRCPSLVIDSEDLRSATGRPRDLADAMRGVYVRLADLDEGSVLRIIRDVS